MNHELLGGHRSLPVLLISPSKDTGRHLVDPAQLASQLFAQVVVATIDSNATWEFSEAFRDRGFEREMGVCFDGATRLYHPQLAAHQRPGEHFLWLPHRLQGFGDAATPRLAGEVAERVSWRALPPRFFSVVEDIDRARVREGARNALLEKVTRPPGKRRPHARKRRPGGLHES